MRNEKTIKKYLFLIALVMSATLLYGGYQVHKEADKKSVYQKSVQDKAAQINHRLTQEMGKNSISPRQDEISFLRVCAEQF